MIQSLLFDTLPESVEIDGAEYKIGYGYRTLMAIEIEMFSDNNDEQKLLNALNLFYLNRIPRNRAKAVELMLWFHRCGEPERKGEGRQRKVRRSYCFKQDAPLFYAAFLQQYGLDLKRTRSCELHWWEFSALFAGLDENTKLAKVMYWRTCNLNTLPKEQRKFVQKMRKLYEIHQPESDMDSQTKLARRNAEMMEYVRKRMEECQKE